MHVWWRVLIVMLLLLLPPRNQQRQTSYDKSNNSCRYRGSFFALADEKVVRSKGLRRRKANDNTTNKKSTMNEVFIRSGKRGLEGGIPGALAGVVQVVTLMWLRTIITYQCRYGTSFTQALKTLIKQGGVRRLYKGLAFALVQAPLCRFVSTAANDGVESLLANLEYTKDWGPSKTTVVASLVVGVWRMILMRTYIVLNQAVC
jgi:hypothetical protein